MVEVLLLNTFLKICWGWFVVFDGFACSDGVWGYVVTFGLSVFGIFRFRGCNFVGLFDFVCFGLPILGFVLVLRRAGDFGV